MNERISVLRIPDAGEVTPDGRYLDRPVLRTSMGSVGTDVHGRRSMSPSMWTSTTEAPTSR